MLKSIGLLSKNDLKEFQDLVNQVKVPHSIGRSHIKQQVMLVCLQQNSGETGYVSIHYRVLKRYLIDIITADRSSLMPAVYCSNPQLLVNSSLKYIKICLIFIQYMRLLYIYIYIYIYIYGYLYGKKSCILKYVYAASSH